MTDSMSAISEQVIAVPSSEDEGVIAPRNLNTRLSQENYDWFHRVRQRLNKDTNQDTIIEMLAITEKALDIGLLETPQHERFLALKNRLKATSRVTFLAMLSMAERALGDKSTGRSEGPVKLTEFEKVGNDWFPKQSIKQQPQTNLVSGS